MHGQPEAIASRATSPNGSYSDGTTHRSAIRYRECSTSSPAQPTNEPCSISPSRSAWAFSSASAIPDPATRNRTPPSRSISRGIASSARWNPFSYTSRPTSSTSFSSGAANRARSRGRSATGCRSVGSIPFGMAVTRSPATPNTSATCSRM